MPAFGQFVDNGDGTGQFVFTPGPDDARNYTITLTASDPGGGPATAQATSQSFVLTVTNPSLPPHVTYIGDKVAVVGQPFHLHVTATDGDQQPLTFSALGLPGSATLTPSTAYGQADITWTPTARRRRPLHRPRQGHQRRQRQSRPWWPAIARPSRSWCARATKRPCGCRPAIRPCPKDRRSRVPLQAIDPDGDPITYSATNLPVGASINPATGVLTWTPTLFQSGTYPGIVLSADDGNLAATQTITITVTTINQTPTFIPLQDQTGREATQLQFTLAANDPNGQTPDLQRHFGHANRRHPG